MVKIGEFFFLYDYAWTLALTLVQISPFLFLEPWLDSGCGILDHQAFYVLHGYNHYV